MAIKMRNNNDSDAVCCSCGDNQNQVLGMYDICIGTNIFTICDRCNETLFSKTLKADCMKNGRLKSQHDLRIIQKRKQRSDNG